MITSSKYATLNDSKSAGVNYKSFIAGTWNLVQLCRVGTTINHNLSLFFTELKWVYTLHKYLPA